MATAKKLPSGSWRCQVFSHIEEIPLSDGTIKKKRVYKSFTCSDPSKKGKRICEQMAAEWAAKKESEVLTARYAPPEDMTLKRHVINTSKAEQASYPLELLENISDLSKETWLNLCH